MSIERTTLRGTLFGNVAKALTAAASRQPDQARGLVEPGTRRRFDRMGAIVYVLTLQFLRRRKP